jgi:hypothetical protein
MYDLTPMGPISLLPPEVLHCLWLHNSLVVRVALLFHPPIGNVLVMRFVSLQRGPPSWTQSADVACERAADERAALRTDGANV